jgi:hypothetical protein
MNIEITHYQATYLRRKLLAWGKERMKKYKDNRQEDNFREIAYGDAVMLVGIAAEINDKLPKEDQWEIQR